jgi:amidase
LLDLAASLAAGEASSTAVVAAALDRIRASQPTLNAFRWIRDQAVVEAADADRRLAAGERLPLLGVPVAVKDDMDVVGMPTAFGCAGEFPVAAADAEAVRRLRAAGAVIVGKTNTPELGQWPFTEGACFGATRNPWNLDHSPGGSSGGSAAAVAAGLVPAALGSDGAGSVRIPAAWTNLVGVKPQRGRISSAPLAEQFNGLTCYGTLGRTVADAAALLDVLTGSAAADRHRPPAPAEPFLAAAGRRPPRRLRIGVSLGIPFSGLPARLDDVVRRAVERLADVLAGCGHDVAVAEVPYGLLGVTFLPRSLAGLREWARRVPDPSLLDPRTIAHIRAGRLLGGPTLAMARAAEPAERIRIGRIFRRVDVVLAPTTATPPPRIGAMNLPDDWRTSRAIVSACPYTWPWNLLGWPAVNVPAGFTADGLPMGAQLVGPANSEARLLSLAAELEDVERWHERTAPALRPASH